MPSYNEAKMVRFIEWKNDHFRKVRRLGQMIEEKRRELNNVVSYINDATRSYGQKAVEMFDQIRRMPLNEREAVDPKTVVKVIYREAQGESYIANMGIDLSTWTKYLLLCHDLELLERRRSDMQTPNEPMLRLVQDLRSQVIAWGFRDPEEIAA
ncbi:MAG: hypothetical protein OJJ55_18680 [Rhodococcus sp.]|nr:hypothetical protein [Rhodococcus sp. (in: high G+C Gram-positive bacteria)]